MKRVIITAGGTSERIDNVRKITNSSSGKLGMLIAKEFLKQFDDLEIYYICSKQALRVIDSRVHIIEIESVEELKNNVVTLLTNNKIDYFIHSMAVSDYTLDYVTTIEDLKESLITNKEVKTLNDKKISSNKDNLVVVLKPTPKIISLIKEYSKETYLVGFKLLDDVKEDELIEVATKLRDKNKCDLVLANDLSSIRKGKHIGFIIDKENKIIRSEGKEMIAKDLVRRIKNEK